MQVGSGIEMVGLREETPQVDVWWPGPLFETPLQMDFYNLELSNTNAIDRHAHDFKEFDKCTYQIQDTVAV